jgi:aldehyde:ferredoxin oxidoreductase
MKTLWVDMTKETIEWKNLNEEWAHLGGSALIAKIMNQEVSAKTDPLGPENHFIVATGPLAGTGAPQLGRISVGAKSPLTLGIKEANSGGPAGQILDRLGIRAVIVHGAPRKADLFYLFISKDETRLVLANEFRQMKNYALVQALREKWGKRIAVISTGIAGERAYKGASVSFTDIYGDPSRNAARGGLGAVMGSKGLKAIVIDPTGTDPVPLADPKAFQQTVRSWMDILKHDVSCSLYSRFGTPFAINNSANQGTLITHNYRSGTPENFVAVSGNRIQEILFERGGKMHGCMPGCVVRCSIVFPDTRGNRLCSAYEYETIALLGTNLGITDNDAIARLKYRCDDLGIDAIETGSSLGLAAEAGKMAFGDQQGAERLLEEIEAGTPLGQALANGVVATARYLQIDRIPAYKGQAIPGHDPRSVKGTGVTYLTSPMGADHTAGLTYKKPKDQKYQTENSLKSQIQAAVCDAFGYCLNAVPGGRESVYEFIADLMNARFGLAWTAQEVLEIGKQTLRDQLRFNEQAEFTTGLWPTPSFLREEALAPSEAVFDVEESEITHFWKGLDAFQEKEKTWEIRIPPMPEMVFGAGVAQSLGTRLRRFNLSNVLVVTDPVMASIGRAEEVRARLNASGIRTVLFSEVEPDPPMDLIERVGKLYTENRCDGILGLGGGSSLDTAKIVGLRVTHPGSLREYEGIVGGGAKIKPILPPIICVPTTSGTGSEVNPCAVLTDRERDLKIVLMNNHLIPKMAVIDPKYCRTMPPGLTIESGLDALAHCIEGYVSLATAYHPYFESMALYGVKLVGRSLVKAYRNGEDVRARTDMCMAAACGGLAFLKGLGMGHAISHVLGARYHIPHGRATLYGLICFVKANKETCKEPFIDLAQLLNRSNDLEASLAALIAQLDISPSLKGLGIPFRDLPKIAFYVSRDAVNMATDPTSPSEKRIQSLLEEVYE